MQSRPHSSRIDAVLAASPCVRPRLLPLALAALLAACTAPTAFERPQGDLPTGWPTGGPVSSGARPSESVTRSAASGLPWQSYFTDPRLQALISLALVNNRDLRIAAAKVQQQRAIYKNARADRLPTVNLQADQSRTSTPADLDTSASSQRFDLQATLSYEIDFWGRVASMSESARANFLATEEARREVELSLVSEIARAYFSLLEKDELLELTRQTLELREQTLAIANQGLQLGGGDEDERQQATVALETSKAALAQLEHQKAVAGNQLNYLVGRVIGDLPPGRALAEQMPGAALEPGVPSEVLLCRPDVIAAEQRLRAANADIDAARAAFFPKVMLTAALGFASPALAALFSGGAWSYQPVLTLPLFDGGRNVANADLAQARKVQAVAEYEKTLQQAFREVADQLSARTSLQLQLESALVSQRALGSRLKTARARFEIGITGYREVLEAQRALLSGRQATLGLRRDTQDAAASLYKVLGGGATSSAADVAVAGVAPSPDRHQP